METKDLMEKAVRFHGHICPGVAIGVLAAKYFLEHGFDHSINEEIVAVVENDNCSVDSLQAILGTTFGKGNLVFLDYGKNVYTLYNRKTQKSLRLSLKNLDFGKSKLSKDEKVQKLLKSRPEDIFNISEVVYDPPPVAQIEESVSCSVCNELTMSSRIVNYQNKDMCIPCYKELKRI